MKHLFVYKNEKGIALVTAMMLLVILTIIGLAAVDTMQMERDIASGETAYRIGFYMADAGISYARTLTESQVPESMSKGDMISVSGITNPPFTLKFIDRWPDKTGDLRFKVESTTNDPTGRAGIITIEAEIKFASATRGAELGPGNETTYN